MEDIKVKINRRTREVNPKQIFIGLDGENLQENVIFSFEDEFVDGQARLEVEFRDGTKGQITEIEQVGETYVLPIKSEITKYSGCIAQLVITEGTDENSIPIFKSMYVGLIVAESINATTPIPEGYTEWIDSANAKLNQIDEKLEDIDDAITKTNNLDLDVSKPGKVATVTLTKKDATTKVVTLSDGTSLMFNWDGTKLGIKTDDDQDYTYVDLQGVQGPIGPKGEAFTIKKTYTSVAQMNADFNNMQLGDYVMIASTVEVEDNAKLYTRGETQWIFISDFSGAQGIKGETGLTPNIQIGTVTSGQTPSVTRTGTNENPILNFTLVKGDTGATGPTGETGPTGNGIASIIKTASVGLVDTYTITYTNGTTSTFEVTNGEDGETPLSDFNALKADVEDLRDNQIILSEQGTNIHVDNAAKARLYEFEFEKESSQHTTTGKNLIGGYDYSVTTVGVSFVTNKDSSIYCNGTSTGSANSITGSTIINNNWLITLPAGTYTLSGGISDVRVQLYDENSNSLASTFASTTFTTTEEKRVWFRVNISSGKTVNNVTIYPQLELGGEATDWEEYTGGQPSPSPEFPQSVKVVEGYRNLLDVSQNESGSWGTDGSATTNNKNRRGTQYIDVLPNTTYILYVNQNISNLRLNEYDSSKQHIQRKISTTTSSLTITTTANTYYLRWSANYNSTDVFTEEMLNNLDLILVDGSQELPYVPYGNNYIAVNVSDGTNTNKYPIPLNNNIIAGIGDYKDELIVDKTGHVYLNKKTNKIVLDGSEESLATQRSTSPYVYRVTINDYLREASLDISLCNYYQATSNGTYNSLVANQCRFRYASGDSNNYFYICDEQQSTLADFKTWLSTHNTEVYYVLETPELIDLQTTVDLSLFKGVNNISNSEDGNMSIRFVESIESIVNSLESRISALEGE